MKNDTFLLSIIIPCYNSEYYIIPCLDSIVSQVDSQVQIIIVNDGSTDNSDTVIKNYLTEYKDHNISYKNQCNNGVSAARNIGLDYAEGKYITFVDSDDMLDNSYWSTIKPIIESEEYDLIDFKFSRIFERDGKISIRKERVKKIENTSINNPLANTFELSEWHVWTRIIKKEIAIADKFEIGKRYEDMLYTPYTYLRAKKILHLNNTLYLYRDNPDSITSNIRESDIHDITFSIKKMIHYIQQTNQSDDKHIKELITYMIVNCFQEVKRMHKKLYGYYNYSNETSRGIKISLLHCDTKHINYKTYLQMKYNSADKFISKIRYQLKRPKQQ
ncbi:glycosyltransferase family 2 protein [Budvicia diplopodorum]|uniref:glycosyltransferase family 2 protein n=1 Tax=Budvicia diplopodorum TaxID=1119056 RepID=UPI001358D0DA|nr:glycosyltransferase [Budvicia diplopodorum]